jgi:prevent-host-death family protein
MLQMNIHEAKTHFSHLLKQSSAGEKVIIANAGEPMWEIIPFRKKRRPGFGQLKGKIWYTDDAFDPMSEEELAEWYKDDLSS